MKTKNKLRYKIFNQLIGKLKSFGCNYISDCWKFTDILMNDPNFENDSNYEISGRYLKTGNPLLIDTEEPEEPIKLMIKKERILLEDGTHKTDLVGFYIEGLADYGNIVYIDWNAGHCEASMEYFWNCTKPTDEEAQEFIEWYEKTYNCKVKRRYKLTHDDCLKIWGKKY